MRARCPARLQARRGVAEVLHRAGSKPQGASPEALSFWVVSARRPAAAGLVEVQMPAASFGQLADAASPAAAAAPPQANLVCAVLAGEGELKYQFMSTRSTEERLRAERELLRQLSTVQPSQGCTVM